MECWLTETHIVRKPLKMYCTHIRHFISVILINLSVINFFVVACIGLFFFFKLSVLQMMLVTQCVKFLVTKDALPECTSIHFLKILSFLHWKSSNTQRTSSMHFGIAKRWEKFWWEEHLPTAGRSDWNSWLYM